MRFLRAACRAARPRGAIARAIVGAIITITIFAPGPSAAYGTDRLGALGLLWLPDDAAPNTPTPLVVVLHDSTGIDPRGWLYGDQMMAAGIAILHVELLDTAHDGVASPARFDEAAAAAARLRLVIESVVEDQRFADARIGLLGFGASGQAATLVAADPVYGSRIDALALLYPGCTGLDAVLAAAGRGPASPVLLQHGDTDPANRPAACIALAARLARTAPVRRLQYAGAGFAWDLRPIGLDEVRKLPWPGRPGARIQATFWEEGAALSATRTASFFAASLLAPHP
jgi:dienelactone hydrolase